MYGMTQPVMGANYMMPMAGQSVMSTANPLNFNYPKITNYKGTQYSSYPKFKQTHEPSENKASSKEITEKLANALKKELEELSNLTKEAKTLSSSGNNPTERENPSNNRQSSNDSEKRITNLRNSNSLRNKT